MSDREHPGLDPIEINALSAALRGAVGFDAAPVLGQAQMFAHVLWRRRQGALATLPS